jgi:LPXTG-motif cell wall-anchored protein
MKKILIASVLCFILVACPLFAFAAAAGTDGWTNLEGFVVDGNKVPAEVSMTDKGLQFLSSKGYYTADGNYSGVFLDTQVDPGNFSVEFTIDKIAGKAPETDTWIGLMLSNNKKYFDVTKPTASQGLVTLIRPWNDDTTHFQTFQMVDAFGANGEGIIKTKAEGATFLVEFKKNKDGTYSYYVNGTKLESIFDGFDDVFADGKAHFSMGCSTNNAQPIQFTITKVNGTPVAELNAVKEEPKAEVKEETANPKTGDVSTIPFMAAAVASGLAGLALIRRKKHNN